MDNGTERTTKDIIHDLEAIKRYFMSESGGCYPVCLEEAIRILETTILEVE